MRYFFSFFFLIFSARFSAFVFFGGFLFCFWVRCSLAMGASLAPAA